MENICCTALVTCFIALIIYIYIVLCLTFSWPDVNNFLSAVVLYSTSKYCIWCSYICLLWAWDVRLTIFFVLVKICVYQTQYFASKSTTPMHNRKGHDLVFVVWGPQNGSKNCIQSLCTWLNINYITVFGLYVCMRLRMCVRTYCEYLIMASPYHNCITGQIEICMHRNGLASPISNKTACLNFEVFVTELPQVFVIFANFINRFLFINVSIRDVLGVSY